MVRLMNAALAASSFLASIADDDIWQVSGSRLLACLLFV